MKNQSVPSNSASWVAIGRLCSFPCGLWVVSMATLTPRIMVASFFMFTSSSVVGIVFLRG